jgi:type III restriction enzyme
MSETDLDRQVRNADAKLGRYGFPNIYGGRYYNEDDPNAHKIDCVLFAADDACRNKLGEYAKEKLREFSRKYRVAIANKSDACKREYRRIMADSAVVSEQLFAIPENIIVREDPDGKEYDNHLLASPETGIAKIKLNGWEEDLIEEEARRSDFLCWLRNPARASWALCLPYDMNGEKKSFYPDFLIVRTDPAVDYVVDILEPHGNQYADNLPKAKALAEYAKNEDRLGRIQLIHKTSDAGGSRFIRLDLTDIAIQEKVLRANNDEELTNIFANYGFSGEA